MSFVNETKTDPIDNDTGLQVRTDINRNMAALYSLNASSAEPVKANCVSRMIWADTGNDELKIRDGTNDAFITIGSLSQTNLGLAKVASPAFTGNVTVPAGTVSSLPFSFTGDTNTGFFKNSADDFSIVTGGTRRVHVDSNGITIRNRKALRLRDTSNSNFVAIQAPSDIASNTTLTLPSSDGNANDVLQSDGSGNLSFVALPQAVPTGSVHMMATTTVPGGYLECDGSAVSRTTHSALYGIIGTAWGAGDGSSTFNVPDLRGEFVRGWASDRRSDGVDPSSDSGRNFSSSQGDQNKQHNHPGSTATSDVDDPGHFHSVSSNNSDSGAGNTFNDNSNLQNQRTLNTNSKETGITVDTSVSVANDGGSEARPRNIAMMYVIKT